VIPLQISGKQRASVLLLALSAAGFSAWRAHEGDGPTFVQNGVTYHRPYVPTKGDVPTIGNGSTKYEDGTAVKMTDPPIPRARAIALARNLASQDEKQFRASIPTVELTQVEYDLYVNFVGQFGIGNWNKSSMRKYLLAGQPVSACAALLSYRFQAKRDCALPKNWGPHGCKGVWTRQQERHKQCMEVQ
jgi:lysozyme